MFGGRLPSDDRMVDYPGSACGVGRGEWKFFGGPTECRAFGGIEDLDETPLSPPPSHPRGYPSKPRLRGFFFVPGQNCCVAGACVAFPTFRASLGRNASGI